jgi:hypothetical protein
MTAWVGAYPYLIEGLLLAGGAVFALRALPRGQRTAALWSGWLLMPFSLTGILFEPEYWNPQRLLGGPIGPEDLLFTFGSGAWAWILSSSATFRPCRGVLAPGRSAARYAAGILGGLAAGVLCRLCGAGPMTAAIVAIALVGMGTSLSTNRTWRQWAAGLLGFTIAHTLVLKVIYHLNPAFALQWNAPNLWGVWVWGIPLEEIVWAAACGAVWPGFMDFVLGVRWTRGEEVQS